MVRLTEVPMDVDQWTFPIRCDVMCIHILLYYIIKHCILVLNAIRWFDGGDMWYYRRPPTQSECNKWFTFNYIAMETVIMHCTHSAGTRSDFTHIVDENMCIAADRQGIWVYICGMREGGVVNATTPPSSSSLSLLYPFMHGRYETKMHRNGDDDI